MTKDETRADELRRKHARTNGINVDALLPWHLLKLSEQKQWLSDAEAGPE